VVAVADMVLGIEPSQASALDQQKHTVEAVSKAVMPDRAQHALDWGRRDGRLAVSHAADVHILATAKCRPQDRHARGSWQSPSREAVLSEGGR
jgi:hypothetical protein